MQGGMGTRSGRLGGLDRRWIAAGLALLVFAATPALGDDATTAPPATTGTLSSTPPAAPPPAPPPAPAPAPAPRSPAPGAPAPPAPAPGATDPRPPAPDPAPPATSTDAAPPAEPAPAPADPQPPVAPDPAPATQPAQDLPVPEALQPAVDEITGKQPVTDTPSVDATLTQDPPADTDVDLQSTEAGAPRPRVGVIPAELQQAAKVWSQQDGNAGALGNENKPIRKSDTSKLPAPFGAVTAMGRGSAGPSAATTATYAVPGAASATAAQTGGTEAGVTPPGTTTPKPKHEKHSTQIIPMVLDALASTVAVIPPVIWGVIAALALLALALLGLAVLRHRHARELARERVDLLADIEALESAVVPSLPEALGGLALSVTSSPAAGPISGGDFHDAFALSRDRVAVIVGDVAGHGRQALSDAQLVRHAVRAYLEAGLDPRGALAMTGTVVDEREEPLFASVIVAVHDRHDGTLTFASAGHEPPILVTEHGAGLPPVSGWSPPLGTNLETGRRQTTIPLPEGSAVCLLTDGVTEARNDGERVGASRVIKWLSALGPGAMSSDIIARLREETDTIEDDATVCMLRALTPATSGAPRIEEALVEGGDPTYLVRFLRDCGLPLGDAEEAGEALAALPDGLRVIASVEIRGGRAVVELSPIGSGAGGFAGAEVSSPRQ